MQNTPQRRQGEYPLGLKVCRSTDAAEIEIAVREFKSEVQRENHIKIPARWTQISRVCVLI